MLGDPNSIVSDAAESRTNVTKFLIFIFIGTLRLSIDFLRDSDAANRAHHGGEGTFLHSLA